MNFFSCASNSYTSVSKKKKKRKESFKDAQRSPHQGVLRGAQNAVAAVVNAATNSVFLVLFSLRLLLLP